MSVVDRLVERWGADPVQWRALVPALLRIDFPVVTKQQPSEDKQVSREERKRVRGVLFVLLFFMLYGITPMLIVLTAKDMLVGATVSVAISAFAVAMTLLTGEADSLLASTDLQVLGYRPVSSRTYLAVRLTTLLVRSVLVAGATIVLPALAFIAHFGIGGVAPAAAVLIAAEAAGVATTFGIVAMYTYLVERVDAERLKKYVAYSQMAASFVVWGGFLIVTQDLVERYVAGLTMDPALWLLFPPTWFASLVPLAGGGFSLWSIAGVLLGAASLVTLARLIRGKLSMGYVDGLTRTATAEAPAGVTSGAVAAWMPAIRNESRAVLLLARSQIVHDMKFRMGLITLMPMTAMYMVIGGWPTDPFVTTRGSSAPLVQMVVMFLPIMVRQVLVQSEAHKAAWILHVTPARRSVLMSASRNVIAAFFLLPYLAILAAVFAYSFGSSAHALIHAGFMGLLAGIILQFDMMLRPQLPFSVPMMKDSKFGAQMITMLFGATVGTAFYFTLIKLAYPSAGRMVIAACICLTLIAIMEWTTRRRINRRRVEDLYFD